MFGWQLVKRLNLLYISLIVSFLDMTCRLFCNLFGISGASWGFVPLSTLFLTVTVTNSILVTGTIANNKELEKLSKIGKTAEITPILCGQFLISTLLTYILFYVTIPLCGTRDDNYRALITGTFPLSEVLPKAMLQLALQWISFLHP